MSSMSNPDNEMIRHQQAKDLKDETATNSKETELEERIERLEKRMEQSVLGEDGVVRTTADALQDETEDALRKAVDRSNRKRG